MNLNGKLFSKGIELFPPPFYFPVDILDGGWAPDPVDDLKIDKSNEVQLIPGTEL